MLTEKDMVNDALAMTKSSCSAYTTAMAGSSCQELRQAYEQLRQEAEQFQYDLGKIAMQKGYYTSSQTANQKERQQLKAQLNQGAMQ